MLNVSDNFYITLLISILSSKQYFLLASGGEITLWMGFQAKIWTGLRNVFCLAFLSLSASERYCPRFLKAVALETSSLGFRFLGKKMD